MKWIILGLIIFLSFFSFYNIGERNYEKHNEIKKYMVNKPNLLPKKEYIQLSSFGFANLHADIYWLELIQYIGGNIIDSSYKNYLYKMTEIISTLNPYFETPYIIGELLLTNYNPRYEHLSEEEQEIYIDQAVEIGKTAVKNFCDKEILEKIKYENNLQKLFIDNTYKNPCQQYESIYNLAFIYFQYKKDPLTAAYYYKVASMIEGAPEGAKNMIAIMNGKGGEHEKSFLMFLNMAEYIEPSNQACQNFSKEIQKLNIFSNKIPENFIKDLEKIQKKSFPFSEEYGLSATKCDTYIQKAIREVNLAYLEEANRIYFKEFGKHSDTPEDLQKSGIISILPNDFQVHNNSKIIYYFDKVLNNYNYKMGKKG